MAPAYTLPSTSACEEEEQGGDKPISPDVSATNQCSYVAGMLDAVEVDPLHLTCHREVAQSPSRCHTRELEMDNAV